MKSLRTLLVAAVLLLPLAAGAQQAPTVDNVKVPSLGSVIPFSPDVRSGTLPNGLKYYIRKNAKPEQRLELRLAVNAGSVLERNSQVGLAHFVEHMAFNGTKNFKKDQLVKYLESIGTRFGADLNAYTSFDETVYMLQLPTDKPELVDKGFLILEDWAQGLSFEGAEIEKERGVIIEELRLGKGASQRMRDKQFPILFKNSLYAERLPIGTEENLKSFPHDTLKAFYHDWYRPELMAVIAVGDIDVDAVEKKIKEHFGRLQTRPNAPARPNVAVPDHDETLFALASDPEATTTQISVYFKRAPKTTTRVMDYRRDMVEQLYSQMFNQRLDELTRKADPPFLFAFGGGGRFVRSKDMYSLGAGVKPEAIARGLDAVLTEAARVRKHGFTETELERAKTDVLRRMERAYEERDKTESGDLAMELVRHFLEAEPVPGITMEYAMYKKYIPSITVADVNALATEFITEKNRVVSLSMPKKDGLTMPTEKELQAVLDGVAKKTIDPYVDQVANKPLIEKLPAAGRITNERKLDNIGVTEWTLSNGARVVMKQTDFKNDEILFGSFSPGGASLTPDNKVLTAQLSGTITELGGLADFDETALRKLLTGKVVNVSPYVQELFEGFNGSVAPKDLRTFFELLYLSFTAPRKDVEAYTAMRDRMVSMYENMGARPESVFSDTVSTVMASYHPRVRPVNATRLKEIDQDEAIAIYRDRFADASDFTFIFVGNFQTDTLRRYAETYLATLPALKRNETWRDNGVDRPTGAVERTVRKGIEQKSTVLMVFNGPMSWSYEDRYILSSLGEHMQRKLREEIREEKGGTYGVGARAMAERYPKPEYTAIVQFGCNPARVDELVATALSVIKDVAENGASDEDIAKILEIQKRDRETSLKQNGFWMGRITSIWRNGDDPDEINWLEKAQKSLTSDALKAAAKKYLDPATMMKFVLLPEKDAETK